MATTVLVMTTGDTGAYLCDVEADHLSHLMRGPHVTVPLTSGMVALVSSGDRRGLPANTDADALMQALRLTEAEPMRGPVVVMGVSHRGIPMELTRGMIDLARRTLAPQDHFLPQTPGPLPRLFAAVRADDHETVHELVRQFPDGAIEVREAYGWFPHAFGLPHGPFASPTLEVTDLVGLVELIAQVDEQSSTHRRVHGSSTVEDPWALLSARLTAHLASPEHRDEEGRTVVVLTHLDPISGCPRDVGRPRLILSAYTGGHAQVEISGNEHLLPELQPGELALRRLAKRGWAVAEDGGSHLLHGDVSSLPRLVARGVEVLRTTFSVASPDHLAVTLHAGGRSVRASDRLALLGSPRPLLLEPQRR